MTKPATGPGVPEQGSASLDRFCLYAFEIILALLILGSLAGLWRIVVTLGLHVPLDPDEGWNAYHSLAAMHGGQLYPPPESLMTNNYPPLSFYVVGLFGQLLGDNIIAGRIVSLGALLGVAAGVAAVVRTMGCRRSEAAISAFFLAGFMLLFSDYVGMDDPQLLGHSLQIVGLFIVIAGDLSLPKLIMAATFFAIAGFVKHNLVALPLALVFWLSLYDRRSAARLVAALVILVIVGLGGFRVGFGFDLLGRLNAPRGYSLDLLWANLRAWLLPAALPLVVLAVLWARDRRDQYVVFCVLYALFSVVIGTILSGGAGVDVNAMFDADIALALSAGVAINRFRARAVRWREAVGVVAATAYALPLALALGIAAQVEWFRPGFWLRPMTEESRLAAEDIEFLKTNSGPAICETLAFCYWAAKPASVDVFNLGQQFLSHARDERSFVDLLNAHYFRVIEFDSPAPFPFPLSIRTALARSYRIDHIDDDGVFLVPK